MTGPRVAVRTSRVLLVALSALVVLPSCGDDGPGAPPERAATVEDTIIPAEDVLELAESYRDLGVAGPGADELDPAEVQRGALSYLIRVRFLEHVGEELGVDVADTMGQASDPLHEQLASSEILDAAGVRSQDLEGAERLAALSRAVALEVFPEVEVPVGELEALHAGSQEAVTRKWRATVSLALFTDAERAQRFADAMDEGASFTDGEADVRPDRMGQLEISPLSDVPEGLEEQLEPLAAGETSEPVSFGRFTVVLRVEERSDLADLSFDTLLPDLQAVGEDRVRRQMFGEWFDEQFREADVQVDPYFGTWDPNTLSVKGAS